VAEQSFPKAPGLLQLFLEDKAMELFTVFACRGPDVDVLIRHNGNVYLACAGLVALLMFGIAKFQFRDKGIAFAIGISFLSLIVFFLIGPKGGDSCGENGKAYALTITPIIGAYFIFQVIKRLAPR
jgi:hypothetical protein